MRDAFIRTVTGQPRPLRQDELAEFLQLALEIQQAEGLTVDAALDRAAEQLDRLRYYQLDWDNFAINLGNWDGLADVIPF
jgi:hypothetical protein